MLDNFYSLRPHMLCFIKNMIELVKIRFNNGISLNKSVQFFFLNNHFLVLSRVLKNYSYFLKKIARF